MASYHQQGGGASWNVVMVQGLRGLWVCWVVMVMMSCVPVRGQAPCSLEDVPVMDGFDVSKFVGRWYEIEWIAPTYQDSGNSWVNYYHDYSADQFGFVTGYYSGKDPSTEECFVGRLANLNTADSPAKMLQYTHSSASLRDYWVLETDYTTYAVAYSCVERLQDDPDTCGTARSWLWSRSKSLPEDVITRARATFTSLCMNSSLLYVTDFLGDDCELETTGSVASALAANGSHLFLLAVSLMMLMFFDTMGCPS